MRRRTPHGVRGLKYANAGGGSGTETSHPAWGAWIEILIPLFFVYNFSSHPAWGAWIEIGTYMWLGVANKRRTPHGVRGLKYYVADVLLPASGRTPHGVRGLKYLKNTVIGKML